MSTPESTKSKQPADDTDPTVEKLSFEEALSRLETRVAEMESGQLSLDAMLKAFESGQRLLRHCQHKLNAVERRIEMLTRAADDAGDVVPFPDPLTEPEADSNP